MPRRHLVARARHRHGRGRPRAPGRVAEVGHRAACSASAAPATGSARLEGPHLPEVPRRPARVRGRRERMREARSSRPSSRATRSTCSPSRSSRCAAPARSGGSPSCTRWSGARTRSPSSSRELLDNVLDMLDGRYPSEEFAELRPRIVWDRVAGHDPRAQGRAPARGHQRRHDPRPRPLRRRTCPTAAASASSTRRWSTRRAPGQTFLLGASTWRIEEITPRPRDRDAGARRAGAVPFWRGDASAARRARRAIGAFAAGRSTRSPRSVAARVRPRRARGAEPARLPARAAARRRASCRATGRSSSSASATRSATGACASCRPSAGACTPRGALALVGADPRRARPRGRRDLVRRRHHRPPPRRRRAARRRPRAGRPGGARGPGRAELRELGAVRRALPRERRPRAAPPARVPGQAHAAVAAAAEGADAARGRQALRPVPDRARDLPRVPARRARPARPRGPAARAAHARAVARRGRDADARRRSPRRCCSTTSPRTCTRATRRTPSAARRRCRSTATCCASCSARRSCAT